MRRVERTHIQLVSKWSYHKLVWVGAMALWNFKPEFYLEVQGTKEDMKSKLG